jgi:hypothetical protein
MQQILNRDFETARQIALKNPMAVRATEPAGEDGTNFIRTGRNVVHLACKIPGMEALHFLETLDGVDFDIGDRNNETPLMVCIEK